MKWLRERSFLIYALFATLIITGCANNNDLNVNQNEQQNQSEQPAEEQQVGTTFEGRQQLLDGAMALFSQSEQVITPTEVYQKVILEKDPNYQVVDIRDAATFGNGNIEGSINIPYAQTANLEQLSQLSKDKKIVIVCFSGHTASQTAAMWSLLGYDAVPMLNGMGGWTSNPDLGAPIPGGPFNLPVDETEEALGSFELPSMLVEDAYDLDHLASKGSKEFLAQGFPAVKPAKVVFDEIIEGDQNSATLVDLRTKSDYQKGHAKGAINIPYSELASDNSLAALDPSKPVILIDYNGHVASKAARILGILGYEAYPIKDGMRVWTADENINGIPPISAEKIYEYPTTEINVDLDAEEGPASCS